MKFTTYVKYNYIEINNFTNIYQYNNHDFQTFSIKSSNFIISGIISLFNKNKCSFSALKYFFGNTINCYCNPHNCITKNIFKYKSLNLLLLKYNFDKYYNDEFCLFLKPTSIFSNLEKKSIIDCYKVNEECIKTTSNFCKIKFLYNDFYNVIFILIIFISYLICILLNVIKI